MGTTADSQSGTATQDSGPKLQFDDLDTATNAKGSAASSMDMFRGDNLRKMALQNLKDRRQRQKQSEIFNQQEALKRKEEEAAAQEEADEDTTTATQGVERIDLT
jgi:hypothetical protein